MSTVYVSPFWYFTVKSAQLLVWVQPEGLHPSQTGTRLGEVLTESPAYCGCGSYVESLRGVVLEAGVDAAQLNRSLGNGGRFAGWRCIASWRGVVDASSRRKQGVTTAAVAGPATIAVPAMTAAAIMPTRCLRLTVIASPGGLGLEGPGDV